MKSPIITIRQYVGVTRKVYSFRLCPGFELKLISYEVQERRCRWVTTICWYRNSPQASNIDCERVLVSDEVLAGAKKEICKKIKFVK